MPVIVVQVPQDTTTGRDEDTINTRNGTAVRTENPDGSVKFVVKDA
jgi:hypothetical protein